MIRSLLVGLLPRSIWARVRFASSSAVVLRAPDIWVHYLDEKLDDA